MVYYLSSYNKRALHVHLAQQAIGLFGPVYYLVGQLAAWLVILLMSPKLANSGRLETPISLPIQYDRRSI